MDNSIRSTADADERGSIEHHAPRRLMNLVRDKEQRFQDDHRTSGDLAHRFEAALPYGARMNWMTSWSGPFPIHPEGSAEVTDTLSRERWRVDTH